MAPGAKSGCKTCHAKHLKCDLVKPTCDGCTRSKRECTWYNNYQFQHDNNPSIATNGRAQCEEFPDDQLWLPLPRKVVFIDESDSLRLIYNTGIEEYMSHRTDGSHVQPEIPDISQSEKSLILHDPLSLFNPLFQVPAYPYESPCMFYCTCLDKVPSILEKSLGDSGQNTSDIKWSHGGHIDTLLEGIEVFGAISDRLEDTSSIEPDSLLRDQQEAFLLRYFIDVLSSWFDLCDNHKHFAIVAPRRALTNPTLLNSICAVSARHLSRVGDYDTYIADNYYQLCLETLIPALDEPAALKDETLFAATVILRLYEELNAPLAGIDPESHLLGAQVLLNAQKYTEMSSGLRQAAFWVALRQEINIALTSERPIQVNFEQCNVDLSFSRGTEGTWAYRSVIHCASVLQFCFSNEEQSLEKWKQLVEYHLKWMCFKPRSFEPLYRHDNTVSKIPEIVYMADVHVTAAQHHTLARILLTAYNPRIPRMGLDMRFTQMSSAEIKNHVYETIGIAHSNPKTASALFTCCIAILSWRTHFTDLNEQNMLLGVLQRTEKEHGWTTGNMQKILRDGWDFEEL